MASGGPDGPNQESTKRLAAKRQTLDDAYAEPANFLEIDVTDPITHGTGRNRFTDYEIRLRTNLPIFKNKDCVVRRRYSDFEWLRNELERDSKIVVPQLPGKGWKRHIPFRNDDGIFEPDFIERRRRGLEQFINKMSTTIISQHYDANGMSRPSDVLCSPSSSGCDNGLPKQFIKVTVTNAVTHLSGRWRFTDYEVKVKTNIGCFKEESSVRRRFSDFLWLHDQLRRLTLIALPDLPNKKLTFRSIPLLNKLEQSNFDEEFIAERRQQLEEFINKVAQHPLAQNQKCLHMFLQQEFIDRRYKPGTI